MNGAANSAGAGIRRPLINPVAGLVSALGRGETLLLILTALLVMGLSGGMLWTVGLNYDGLSGSAPQKVHPSTYLACLCFGWAMLRHGNPVGYLVQASRNRPASCFIAACGVGFLLFIGLRGGTGLAGALDTFTLPGLVVILMAGRDRRTMTWLERVVHGVMIVNALMGLLEFVSGQRFFPFRLDGQIFETDTRSAALQGHPLNNATLTACYVLALISGGGEFPRLARAALIGLQLAALVTFGGRSASVMTVALGGAYGLVALHRVLRHGRVPLLGVAAAIFLLTLVPIALGGLVLGGFFDTLLGRFASDGGSAHARVGMLELIGRFPLRDMLIGPDAALVDSWRRIEGLEWGIENPVVKTLLYHGALMTALLTLAVTLFLFEVARLCRPGIAMPMLAFVILVNTFEGLGGKTTLLAKFALLLIVMYRPPLSGAASAGRGRG
ncbi:VpsF family polysaccharide biosynthesis protein [Methylobacterium nigriterrae]|uniref:VpsF family polysaccharide biosynthesis protein n=1 Tax=Methylobacterium nigriterrae TaxID=3127512 RepID=UPI003013AF9C